MEVDSGFGRRRARIEMIPLIDVVFLLLVFFIYAMLSMTVFRGLDLELPRAEGGVQPQSVLLTLDRDNRLLADEELVLPAQAVSWALEEHERTGLPVLIRGDREADFGVALELLAALQEAGLEAVSFQVQGSPDGARPAQGGSAP